MSLSGRLSAVALFAGVSLLALAFSGLFDWISSSLFLVLEFLAQCLRRLFGHPPRSSESRKSQPRRIRGGTRSKSLRSGRLAHHKRRLGRKNREIEAETMSGPRPKVLVALSGEEPDLVTFALGECRSRNAELLLVFLRPMAVIPMGPNPLPGLSEDADANCVIDGVKAEASCTGVFLRTFYETTTDPASAILAFARQLEADVVIVGSRRRGRLHRVFTGDVARSILSQLPEHASLLVHAT